VTRYSYNANDRITQVLYNSTTICDLLHQTCNEYVYDATGERVEGRNWFVVVGMERVECGLSVGACAVDGSRTTSARGRDRHLPHSRPDLLNGTCASKRAPSRRSGRRGTTWSPDGEVLDAHAPRPVDAAGDIDAAGEGTVSEFPRDSPCGGEPTVDADLGGAVGGDVSAPQVMCARAVDVRFEALADRRHRRRHWRGWPTARGRLDLTTG
jgi:hypothetical protein